MALNRKRPGDESPTDGDPSDPGSAMSTQNSRTDDPSDPMGQSSPDTEIVEARLAAGEADADRFEDESSEDPTSGREVEAAADELQESVDLAPRRGRGGGSHERGRGGVIGFARGSWRELQRVQWPDQRQVVQATGVVIGFVIVAGAYLGLADWVAGKIVHFILS